MEEAVQLLEQTGLLLRESSSTGGSMYKLTRLGAAVLAKGPVRDQLPSAAGPDHPLRNRALPPNPNVLV